MRFIACHTPCGVCGLKKTEENRKFWKNTDKAKQNVDKWPEWKKNIKLTKYSIKGDKD